jgi:osmoprotectant transport system ATP-binding protein
MITLSKVSKNFNGQPAVDAVSLQANDKEILVLLGTSGCGKTTTLKMINRLIEPDAGNIFINGKDIKSEKPEALRKNIGFVMQHTGLFPHYTIEENIAVLPELLKWDKKKTSSRIAELLEKLHLPAALLKRFPNELSGGQQQRVGIARALVANTPVLLMDEPFGALDTITKADIHKEFKELDELKNKTTVLVTHDVQEAFELGHRICLMDKGKIVQTGAPKEMLYHPANDFVTDFFAANRLVLEYKIVSLKELKPYLSDYMLVANDATATDDSNIWEVLQKLSATPKFNSGYEAVVQAFSHYRKLQTV